MNAAPALFWAKIWLRLGLVLVAVGVLPLLAQQFLFTDTSPIIPTLLSVMVAPLGVVCLAIGIILFLVAWVRRRPGPS